MWVLYHIFGASYGACQSTPSAIRSLPSALGTPKSAAGRERTEEGLNDNAQQMTLEVFKILKIYCLTNIISHIFELYHPEFSDKAILIDSWSTSNLFSAFTNLWR